MNYQTKKSITRETILFLIFLAGIFLIVLAEHHKAIAVNNHAEKGFLAGRLFIAVPDGDNLQSKETVYSHMAKSSFLYKIGFTVLVAYALYVVARLIPWAGRKIKRKHSGRHYVKGGLNMNNWMKQNWFKAGLLLCFMIMSLSVAYYFVLFLPGTNNHKVIEETVSKTTADNVELQNKCFAAASAFFKESGFDSKSSGFQNHYNNKLNKCFINIKSAKMGEDGRLSFNNLLYDVYNRKKYGEYSWKPEEGKNYWEVKPTVCFMLDKDCGAIEDYENFIKVYIEE
ncbi:MAG: hypothetical protein PHP17_01170 [Candidatus Omnitrophica bacterium]|nr:hypothetical protein [Candidatus Omnitrophota bacterium]